MSETTTGTTATKDNPEFKLSTSSKFIILTAVLASLLEIIDTSIVNVAIPTMMGNLGATLEDISWVVTGYIVANAIVLPLSGWLGSRIGRRRYYIGCILLFTATSVACGLAPNLFTLVIFRILQGLAGGALLPTSQALIQEQFPKEKAGIGSAIYGMSVMIGPTIGPTLGGYLTDNFGWRSIFNINLPLGLVAALTAGLYIADLPKRVGKTSIDGWGLGLLTVGIGSLQFVLERGQADDWFDSNGIVICTLLAAICLPAFVWWELKVEHPIVNLRLFKDPIMRSGTLLMMAVGTMLFGTIFVLPVFAGRVLHYDATQTGLLFLPGALLTALCMPFVGASMKKLDARILILIGIIFCEVFLLMMTTFTTQTDSHQMFWTLIVRGLGMACLFVPINTVVLGHFRGVDLGQAAGLMNLSRQIGGSIGIAMITTMLDRVSHQNYVDLAAQLNQVSQVAQQTLQQTQLSLAGRMSMDLGLVDSGTAALKSLSFRLNNQVFILSFAQLVRLLFIIYGFSLIPLYFLKTKPGEASGPVDLH